MPFESEAQRRFMFAQHPRIAKRWAKETPKGKDLPEKKTDSDPEETQAKAEAEKNAAIRTLGIKVGLIKNSNVASSFFKNLVSRVKDAPRAVGSKLKNESLNFLDKKFFDYGGSDMLPIAAELAPGALFYSLRDLPGHLSKSLGNKVKSYTLGGALSGGLTGGVTGEADGLGDDKLKRILIGALVGGLGGAGGRGAFNMGKGLYSYAPIFKSKLKDLYKLYEGGTMPYLMGKGLPLTDLRSIKSPLKKAFQKSKKLRSLEPIKDFLKKWDKDHFSKRNELNVKMLTSGGSGQGLMGADAIKNLGLDTVNAGLIVNPNILKFITNTRYQQMLADAGIKRMYGSSWKTLKPVSDEANAASAKIKEALDKLIQEKAPSGYNKLKSYQDIIAKDMSAEIAAIKADTSLKPSEQLTKIRDLKSSRKTAVNDLQNLLEEKFDKYSDSGSLKSLITDLSKQNLGLTHHELQDAVRLRFNPSIRKVRDVFNEAGNPLVFDSKLAPNPQTGILGFDIPVYRDLKSVI